MIGHTWAYGVDPHFLFYEGVSVIRWVIPYKYRKILGMLFKLMKLCGVNYNIFNKYIFGTVP